MRTLSRHIVAGLLIAAAASTAASVATFVATPAQHSIVAMGSQTCPQGTNWNNTACT